MRTCYGIRNIRASQLAFAAYLDEFTFRLNRRTPESELLFYRLLEQDVAAPPIRYRDLLSIPPRRERGRRRHCRAACQRAWPSLPSFSQAKLTCMLVAVVSGHAQDREDIAAKDEK